jgi:two-component system LytT family response regulator
MKTLRTMIVDDEDNARGLLRSMLTAWPRIRVVGDAADGESAVTLARRESPDLLFLDVQMPGMSGFDVVAALSPDAVPMIVFVTAFDQYALRAFEVSACDYLLKPFDEDRLAITMQRVIDRYDRADRPSGLELQSLLSQLRGATESQVVVKVDGRHIFLDADEIDWIEADGKDLSIHAGKSVLRVRESMSSLEGRLPGTRFLRVHRSAMVNRSRVREMQPWFGGDHVLILRDGTRVITGRTYREAVQELTRGLHVARSANRDPDR